MESLVERAEREHPVEMRQAREILVLEGKIDRVRMLAEEWIALGVVSVYESSVELGEAILAALDAEPESRKRSN